MQPLPAGSVVRVQWFFAGLRSYNSVQTEIDASDWFLGLRQDERNAVRDQRQKQRMPLLVATGRVAVASPSKEHAYSVIHRIVGAYRALEMPGAHFMWRMVPSWLVCRRVAQRQIPIVTWPLTVSTLEAVGLAAFPLDGAHLPGLRLGSSRQVPPSLDMPTRGGAVIGESTYPGTPRPLVLPSNDRLMHAYISGPPGVGKSTLLASIALQDIESGYGCIVVDPKNDLADSILARFPEHRLGDLRLLDAANTSRPLGFNPLRTFGDEHARELAAETTVHILRSIFKDFWGPRTECTRPLTCRNASTPV